MARAILPPTADVRRDRALRVLLALYLATALAVAVQRTLLSHENNFIILRSAYDHLIAGKDLYAAYPALHADYFKYSPTFAFLFAPFAQAFNRMDAITKPSGPPRPKSDSGRGCTVKRIISHRARGSCPLLRPRCYGRPTA